MKNTKILNKAINIAVSAHAHQTDKAGQPYVFHLLRVSEKGKTETEKICGLLHDLVEDTDWTFEKLKNEGFSDEIIDILKCLTKLPFESYPEYINRIVKNPIAIQVKINDLEDNMDITRLEELTDKDFIRLMKYHNVYKHLKALV
ncbi:MAG: phosphohydrolase [Flavobacteriaceae bacterium]|nr:phosphohydrolase [Flavobacteriaceae bacterium]